MKNREVNSIKEVDLSGMKMPVISVYEHPEDFPEKCVARIFELDQPTDVVVVKKTVKEINKDIRKHTNMVQLARTENDVASLVCMWV